MRIWGKVSLYLLYSSVAFANPNLDLKKMVERQIECSHLFEGVVRGTPNSKIQERVPDETVPIYQERLSKLGYKNPSVEGVVADLFYCCLSAPELSHLLGIDQVTVSRLRDEVNAQGNKWLFPRVTALAEALSNGDVTQLKNLGMAPEQAQSFHNSIKQQELLKKDYKLHAPQVENAEAFMPERLEDWIDLMYPLEALKSDKALRQAMNLWNAEGRTISRLSGLKSEVSLRNRMQDYLYKVWNEQSSETKLRLIKQQREIRNFVDKNYDSSRSLEENLSLAVKKNYALVSKLGNQIDRSSFLDFLAEVKKKGALRSVEIAPGLGVDSNRLTVYKNNKISPSPYFEMRLFKLLLILRTKQPERLQKFLKISPERAAEVMPVYEEELKKRFGI